MDSHAHGHLFAPDHDGRDDPAAGRAGGAERAGERGPHRCGCGLHSLLHRSGGHGHAVAGLPAAKGDRRKLPRIGHQRRMLRLYLCAGSGGRLSEGGQGAAHAGGVRREHEPHRRLDRPLHLRAVRRRRGCGGAGRRRGPLPREPHQRGQRHAALLQRALGQQPLHAARRGDAGPLHGWPGDLQVRRVPFVRRYQACGGACGN